MLLFLTVWVKSHDSVHKPQFLKRKESWSRWNRGPSVYQPTALPLGHTGSHLKALGPAVLLDFEPSHWCDFSYFNSDMINCPAWLLETWAPVSTSAQNSSAVDLETLLQILPHKLHFKLCCAAVFSWFKFTPPQKKKKKINIIKHKTTQSEHHHSSHLSLNRKGRSGTTDDFTISFLHFSLFSIFWGSSSQLVDKCNYGL